MRLLSTMTKIRIKQFLVFHKQFWRLYVWNLCVVGSISLFFMVLVCLDEDIPPWIRSFFWKIDIRTLAKQYKDETTVYVDTRGADKIFQEVSILCFILTTKSKLHSKIQVVNNTWAKRCNKVLYVMCADVHAHDILSTCDVGESKYHLTGKVRYTLIHSYFQYLNKYDWFLKADDDTYVIMENLRYLLSQYPVSKPGYLGYHFNIHVKQGYMSGGAGYVINRQGLKQLVERGFQNKACYEDGGDEDVEIGKCLQFSKVPIFSSLDKFGRETFHTDKPWQHVWGMYPSYLNYYSKNGVQKGLECCSQFAITYHHVNPPTMLFIEHMLYRTSVYGRHGLSNVSDMFPKKIV